MPTPMRSRGAGVDTGDLRDEETGSEPGDVRRRGRRESPPEDLGPGDPCDERSGPHDVPMPSARAGGSNLTQEVGASGGYQLSSRRWRQYGELAGNEHTRRWGRPHPLPSESDGHLSTHPAQASDNPPAWPYPARVHRPQTPLTERGRPIGLGVDLDGTSTEPATEDRRGPHHGRGRPRQICFAPEPVSCRFPSADTRGKSARFRAG